MRSNPLNNDREPDGRLPLGIASAAIICLGVAGFALNARVGKSRAEIVQLAVSAAGYGEAVVAPIKGEECWRAREGFTWKTGLASGSACAGPGSEVHLFPGQPRPSLSGVAKLQAGGSRHDPL